MCPAIVLLANSDRVDKEGLITNSTPGGTIMLLWYARLSLTPSPGQLPTPSSRNVDGLSSDDFADFR